MLTHGRRLVSRLVNIRVPVAASRDGRAPIQPHLQEARHDRSSIDSNQPEGFAVDAQQPALVCVHPSAVEREDAAAHVVTFSRCAETPASARSKPRTKEAHPQRHLI
jgi:hypothetical protein